MRCRLLIAVMVGLGLACAPAFSADDESEIKHAIPLDSAMMQADFDRLAHEPTVPSPSKVEDKSLTLMLLGLKVKDDEKAREQFRFLVDGYPQPSKLAEELCRERRTGERRILLEPVTFVHTDRITDFTCIVHADRAAGTVSFKVTGLYQGKVDYVAQRLGGKWFIVEFIMPAYGIHIVRADNGQWKEKAITVTK